MGSVVTRGWVAWGGGMRWGNSVSRRVGGGGGWGYWRMLSTALPRLHSRHVRLGIGWGGVTACAVLCAATTRSHRYAGLFKGRSIYIDVPYICISACIFLGWYSLGQVDAVNSPILEWFSPVLTNISRNWGIYLHPTGCPFGYVSKNPGFLPSKPALKRVP